MTADHIVDLPPWKDCGLPGNKEHQLQQETGMVLSFDLVSSQLGDRGSTHQNVVVAVLLDLMPWLQR